MAAAENSGFPKPTCGDTGMLRAGTSISLATYSARLEANMQTFVVDISEPTETEHAPVLAAKAVMAKGDKVFLFHNVYHRNIIDADGAQDQVLTEARELLLNSRQEQLTALAHEHFGEDAEAALVWCEAGWQELIRFAVSHRANMVIAEGCYRSHWKRFSLTNEDWELIRHCPLPLLLARPNARQRYGRVVAAIDPLHADDKPAALDRQILSAACEVAKPHKARVSVVNFVPPATPLPSVMEPVVVPHQVNETVIQAHQGKVDELVEGLDYPIEDKQVSMGTAAQEIPEHVARKKGDLLVMGAVSRSTVNRLLIGSTAERVLDNVGCDVLIIKPPVTGTQSPELAAIVSG